MTAETGIALRLQFLARAVQTGHAFVPVLIGAASKMIVEFERRGWA